MSMRTLLTVVLTAGMLLTASAVFAAPTCNYSIADGNWSVASNWSVGVVPNASYSAVVSYDKSIVIDTDISSSVLGRLWVGFDDGSAYIGDGTLTLNTGAKVKSYNVGVGTHPGTTGYLYLNDGSIEITGADSYLGYSGTDGNMSHGYFVQTGGTATLRNFYVGNGAYTQGTLTITGDDSVMSQSTAYTLGIGSQNNSTGYVTIGTAGGSDTPELSVGTLELGRGYSSATGDNCVGTFTAQGASVFSGARLYIGGTHTSAAVNGVGHVYVKDSASFTISGDSQVGRYGTGTFTQTGGTVSLESTLSLGASATADGTFTISDGTLGVDGDVNVGTMGTGEFKVQDVAAMITWSGNASFGANGTLSYVAGATGVSGIVMDTDTATVSIDAAVLSFDLSAMSSASTDIVLIDNYGTDAISGEFSNYAEGDTVYTFGDGSSYKLSYVYNAGSDVSAANDLALVAQAIPEPSTLALIATGLIGLLAYAWRKRK